MQRTLNDFKDSSSNHDRNENSLAQKLDDSSEIVRPSRRNSEPKSLLGRISKLVDKPQKLVRSCDSKTFRRLIRVTSDKDDPVQRQENRVRLQNIKEQKKGPKKDVTSETQLMYDIEDLEKRLSQARLRRIRANRKVKIGAMHIVIVTNRLPVQVVKKCEWVL